MPSFSSCLFLIGTFVSLLSFTSTTLQAQEEKKDSTENLYNQSNTQLFADYLFKSQQFDLAAREYERLLYFDDANDSLKLQVARSMSLQGPSELSLRRTEKLYPSIQAFPQSIAKLYTKDAFSIELYPKISPFLIQKTSLERRDQVFLNSYFQLHQLDWKGASLSIEQLKELDLESGQVASILLDRGQNLKYKKPGLALAMSAVIPGSGKFYTKDWKDGLFSMLIIGGNAFQAYRGFKDKGVKSARGWVFATLGTGFYIGNLFGSHKAAKVYNKKLSTGIQNQVMDQFLQGY